MPVLARKDFDQGSEIENSGHPILVQVQPPRPARALQGYDEVFWEGWEVRVKILEEPSVNLGDVDAYDLVEDVMTALHWSRPGGEAFLAYPLQLAARPVVMMDDLNKREIDVIFNATLGLTAA